MRRAFLSHSSDDKDHVRDVAQRLGRIRSHLDEHSFEPGEDFRDAIRGALENSDVFVFFVSERSLASSWCQFELDEAELRTVRRSLGKSVAIFLDQDPDPRDLPTWLSRVRGVPYVSAGHAARTIELLLRKVQPHLQRPFIGRSDELQRGVRKLAASSPTPRIIVATGLEGIGKRTYLEKLVHEALSLDMSPEIDLDESATIEDLFVQTLRGATVLTAQEAKGQLDWFRALSEHDQQLSVADQLTRMSKNNSAPCIVDRGAMLNADGEHTADYAGVLRAFIDASNDTYLCISHTRSPRYRNLEFRKYFYERRIRRLEQPDSQALISRLLREEGVPVTPQQTEDLGRICAGYPPTAYYLANKVEEVGAALVLAESAIVNDFQGRTFSRFLSGLPLGEADREILAYLANESRVSLEGIAVATGRSEAEAAASLLYLSELSVVEPVNTDYAVAPPIQRTIVGNGPGLGRRWYERALGRLESQFWGDDGSIPELSVVDATLSALLRVGSGRESPSGQLIRPSIVIRAAQERYHDQDFQAALDYCDAAERLGRKTLKLLEIRIKSLAQIGEFGTARRALSDYISMGDSRQFYLSGFVALKQRQFKKACSEFQRGYARGDRRLSLLREYGRSLYQIGSVAEALTIVDEALEIEPNNVYVLDLKARILITGGSESAADAAVSALESADTDGRFALSRRASFLLAMRGNAESNKRAVALSEDACSRPDAPFEAFTVLARALIKVGNSRRYNEVKEVMKKRRPGQARNRVLDRLDGEAALASGDWRRAERYVSANAADRASRTLRLQIMRMKASDGAVFPSERAEVREEIEQLERLVEESENEAGDDDLRELSD